ncbi:hypothetical protein TNCV_2355901 [Trichonephila clavipes]|nr:hypothetical protein TNCV_2355901 [Trichonephila clavipes]
MSQKSLFLPVALKEKRTARSFSLVPVMSRRNSCRERRSHKWRKKYSFCDQQRPEHQGTSVEKDQHSERPQTARNALVVEKVENLMRDRRLTVRNTAEQVEISTDSPYAILCDHQSGCEICSQPSVGGTERTTEAFA